MASAPAYKRIAPVGRERELGRLCVALEAASGGARSVVLVAGPSGVGKSSLIEQLAPMVRARGGRFVTGKFDQHNERETAALVQALGALARLVLEDCAEDERTLLRGRILRSLGAQAGLARVVPAFADLLADVPDARPVDPAHAAARMAEVVAGLLRAIASAERPLVLVLDDLQWSGALSTRLVDAVLAAPDLAGLVLIGAYRDDGLPASHPLAAAIHRWRATANGPELLQMSELGEAEVAELLMQLMPLPQRHSRRLAALLAPYARGNPYDTRELVGALIDEGLLAAGAEGMAWDDDVVRRFLERNSVESVLGRRIARLPVAERGLLQALACLGPETSREASRVAVGMSAESLADAVDVLRQRNFLIEASDGGGTLKLRHDRVQQVAHDSLGDSERVSFQLGLARRLATDPNHASLAADQYLRAREVVRDAAEALRASELLRNAAAHARHIGNHAAAHRMQSAALQMLELAHSAGAGDVAALAQCEIECHLALYTVGRLEEADAMYRRIEARRPGAVKLIDAACAQVSSLANRERLREAIALGLQVLRDLGLDPPRNLDDAQDFSAEFERLRQWVETYDAARECARAEMTVPWAVASAKMLYRLVTAAVFADLNLLAWVIFQSRDLWEEVGPCAPLVVTVGQACFVTNALRDDRRTGYLAVRQALDLCDARGWEPEASHLRFVYAATVHWFEPLERPLAESERAREGLVTGGDLRNATFSYRQSAQCIFECGPTLRRYAEEVEGAFALSQRADNRQAIARCLADLELLRSLLGDDAVPRSREARPVLAESAHAWVESYRSLGRAIACAIFGNVEELVRNTRVALGLRHHSVQSFYSLVWAHWLFAVGTAWSLQSASRSEPAEAPERSLADIDDCIEWMRQRTIDAPFNFRHMHLHMLAERAWAVGDADTAARRFDEALGAAEHVTRPWHRALITERAARLHLAQGWRHSGMDLLTEALELYTSWGAVVKVAQLSGQVDRFVQNAGSPRSPPAARSDELAEQRIPLLRAAQALGTERTPASLCAKLEKVIAEMAFATRLALVWRGDESGAWEIHSSAVTPAETAPQGGPGLPATVLRYAERTAEPLLIADALQDGRFAADPYFVGMEKCAVLVVPVAVQGRIVAMLLLENRLARGAFETVRLDAVTMIAAQLVVSVENARLYDRLERKVREQTEELSRAQSRLADSARRAGMAQIATNVLHNVGNVLTSVNVSAHLLAAQVRQSRSARVRDLATLMEDSRRDPGFFSAKGKGPRLPAYMKELAGALEAERTTQLAEIDRIRGSVDHIKNVVATQLSYTRAAGALESCAMQDVVEDVLRIEEDALARTDVTVVREFERLDPMPIDRTRVTQILVNLVENARQAMDSVKGQRKLTIGFRRQGADLAITVRDSGCGILPEDLGKMFSRGFTTKEQGHGFGLHSCALAAAEVGGALEVHSAGAGAGAEFSLRLPVWESGKGG